MSVDRAGSSHTVGALLRARRALLADVDLDSRAPERVLVRSDLTGTLQLYEFSGGELTQLTSLPEQVGTAHYVPGTRLAVLAVDLGGDERHQLYLLDLDRAADAPPSEFDQLDALTEDPRFGHHFAAVSPDGSWIGYLSNRANGVDFDLWGCELASREHRRLYASGSFCQVASGCSPDGRLVSLLRPGDRSLDFELVLVDRASGEVRVPIEHADEAALVGPPAWIDGATFYASSNLGRDFSAVVRHELATGTTTHVRGTGERFDTSVASGGEGRVVVVENRGGAHAIHTYDPAAKAIGAEVPLPEPGVVEYFGFFAAPIISADGMRLYYTLTSPRLAGDVFAYEFATGATRRLTHSPAEIEPADLVGAELGQVSSFDGEEIPFFIFRPRDGESRPPVVVAIHGGPEAQARLAFDPLVQALVAVGYGVVVPNVRGSTGYGKRYAALDDKTRRLDSVRDLEAIHGALGRAGFDPDRAALLGGSYGGYMVLAGLAFQPELWAAGIDVVGVSNLVTFLENTSPYRRAFREHEYGSLEHERDFLTHASPLTHVDSIRAPLFVIHGENDPRVPVSEARQLVDGLRTRGLRCELRVYDDEGHGLARLANQLDAYPAAIEFLDAVLRRGRP